MSTVILQREATQPLVAPALFWPTLTTDIEHIRCPPFSPVVPNTSAGKPERVYVPDVCIAFSATKRSHETSRNNCLFNNASSGLRYVLTAIQTHLLLSPHAWLRHRNDKVKHISVGECWYNIMFQKEWKFVYKTKLYLSDKLLRQIFLRLIQYTKDKTWIAAHA